MTQIQASKTYRGLTLDPFQQEALALIDQNFSVLVAAPTGVGKTLIADYLIERVYRDQGRVVYTAPIKALSNQKFKEFKAHIGEDAVGILTGDVVVNPDAPILIMTTEIFRNLLQQNPERVADVRYVIFDEIHYIDDPQRGSVWEESLIFMPPQMRFLGLSATIPNVEQLAEWISGTQNSEVKVVTHFERAVPLKHLVYEKSLGVTNITKVRKKFRGIASQRTAPWLGESLPSTSHLDLLAEIKDSYLPCLFFTFSRKKCEVNAVESGQEFDFLSPAQKNKVKTIIAHVLERYPPITSERWSSLRRLLMRGIGYHHAGMLPVLKDIVEELFAERLIPVVYCTETFAVGLNFPCKTVCFESPTKWDGTSFRAISNREYFQMAGRAGRRGIDTEGFAFTLVNMNYFQPQDFPSMKEQEIEPLQSQFSLSYNSILNLVKNYEEEDIFRILGKNFATFQASVERDVVRNQLLEVKTELDTYCENMDVDACPMIYDRLMRKKRQYEAQLKSNIPSGMRRRVKQQVIAINKTLAETTRLDCKQATQRNCRREGKVYKRLVSRYKKLVAKEQTLDPQQRFFQEFRDKKALLQALGYLEDDKLTTAGEVAAQIHGHELLITEMFMEGLVHDFDIPRLCAIMVSVGYEPRKNEMRIRHRLDFSPVQKLIYLLTSMEDKFLNFTTITFNDHLAALVVKWVNGESFKSIMSQASIDEGDVVFAIRRGIDLLRQIRNATIEDTYLSAKLKDCISKMDRDEVSIWL